MKSKQLDDETWALVFEPWGRGGRRAGGLRADGSAKGGHLLRGVVRPTLEIVLHRSPAHLRKRHDAASGMALIDLDA